MLENCDLSSLNVGIFWVFTEQLKANTTQTYNTGMRSKETADDFNRPGLRGLNPSFLYCAKWYRYGHTAQLKRIEKR